MVLGNNFKGKKTTVAVLPQEVIRHEILPRLPIKSVVRFKLVCKSWLSLFSDPEFVKEHVTRNTTQNPNDYDCLVAEKHNKIVILSRYKEIPALKTLKALMIGLVGSVRGLVCLLHDDKLSLWNPAIHQSKEFTLPPSLRRDHMNIMGFGFDPTSDAYKVVVLSRELRSASVYYSNSDSWIDVSVPNNVYPLRNTRNILDSSTTIVRDCPYWTFRRLKLQPRLMVFSIVKFDAGNNEFKLLPEFHLDLKLHENYAFRRAFSHEFVEMNDCLTLIVSGRDQNSSNYFILDIYSLDREDGDCVWSKMYSIGPFDFENFFMSQGFYGGELVYHDGGMFSCYDHKIDTINHLSTTYATIKSCFRYTPSLVFLEGMKYVYLTTQTRRTRGRCSPQRLINSLRN